MHKPRAASNGSVPASDGELPVIGVSGYAEQARWGVWDVPAVLLPARYVEAVVAAGGVPVVLPPVPVLIERTLSRLDAVVIAGGPDVDPARYGERPGPATQPPRPQRDAAELGLLSGAGEAGLPVLAICRGMQLLNVARGGSLVQHLPDVVGHHGHAPTPGVYGRHAVRVEPRTRLATALGTAHAEVPTYHHQGIARLGSGLSATAWADDGTIEAVEDPELPFCVGVQWHPEAGDDMALFQALVAAANAARADRVRRDVAAAR